MRRCNCNSGHILHFLFPNSDCVRSQASRGEHQLLNCSQVEHLCTYPIPNPQSSKEPTFLSVKVLGAFRVRLQVRSAMKTMALVAGDRIPLALAAKEKLHRACKKRGHLHTKSPLGLTRAKVRVFLFGKKALCPGILTYLVTTVSSITMKDTLLCFSYPKR